jgi:hypothetical protein
MVIQMVLAAFLSLVVMAASEITRPVSARCAPGWAIADGVRRSGEFACSPPVPRNCGEPKGPFERVPCPPLPQIHGQIWCGDDSEPVLVDHQAVACRKRRPSS